MPPRFSPALHTDGLRFLYKKGEVWGCVYYLGIDPGKDKCGLALVGEKGQVIAQKIVPSGNLIKELKELIIRESTILILGDGTTSKKYLPDLEKLDLPVKVVKESYSTLEAKELYFKENGFGWQILLPKGMRFTNRPLDDYAARVLVERYLKEPQNGQA